MGRGKNIAMVVIGLAFVAAAIFMWVVEPESWPIALTAGLFFSACAAVGAIEGWGDRLAPATRARLMGAFSMVMGLGCGALAWTAWQHPGAFDRAPQAVSVAVGLIGLLFFGVGGLLLLIRGGRPFGTPRH